MNAGCAGKTLRSLENTCHTLYIDTNIFKLPDSAFAAFLRGSCALQIALIIIIIIIIPEHLRGVFTTRHYTNPRLPLPDCDVLQELYAAGHHGFVEDGKGLCACLCHMLSDGNFVSTKSF